jgi:hypothetical protein
VIIWLVYGFKFLCQKKKKKPNDPAPIPLADKQNKKKNKMKDNKAQPDLEKAEEEPEAYDWTIRVVASFSCFCCFILFLGLFAIAFDAFEFQAIFMTFLVAFGIVSIALTCSFHRVCAIIL